MGKMMGIGLVIVLLVAMFNTIMGAIDAVLSSIGGIGIVMGFGALVTLVIVLGVTNYRDNRYQRDLNNLEVELKKVTVQQQLALVQRQLVTNNIILPDANGLFPMTLQALDNPNVQLGNLQIAHRLQQSKDNVLQTLSYAPSYTNKVQSTGAEMPVALLTGDTPSFWSLVEQDKLPKDKMLLGYDENNEQVTGTWGEIRSTLCGGKSGYGKSTLLRSMLAQAALQDSKFVVVDPHYNSGEESLGHSLQPLKSLMLTDVAHDDKTMSQALAYVQEIGKARLAGKDKNRENVVLVVDEVTALLSRSNVADQLNDTLQFIATETRKVNVFCFAAGQNFNASIMPSETRNNFVSMFGFQMRRDTARAMSGNTEFAQQVESLAIGQMIWFAPSGDCIPVSVPNVTEDDLKRVAERRFGKTTDTGVEVDFQSTSKALPDAWIVVENDVEVVDGKLLGSDTEVTPEVANSAENARIVQLFLDGNSITSIVKTIYGIDGGRNFPVKTEYVNSVLRGKMK